MCAAAYQQQIFVIAKRKAVCVLVHKNPVNRLCVLERKNVRAALVHFEEIAAVAVDEREMRGKNDFLRRDFPVNRNRGVFVYFDNVRILVDIQTFGERGEELQRVKLRLIFHTNRADCRKGQGNALAKLRV